MALQDDINNFGSTSTAIDLVSLAAQVANTTTNRIVKVDFVDNLPDLANNTADGSILFVESINTPVIAHAGSWRGLDGRTLRVDYPAGLINTWGLNNCGQLGDGTITSRLSPISVVGGFTDWCRVSAGYCYTLGVKNNGTLWAWGSNLCGRLGDGTVTDRSSPVSVIGGFTDWCQISAGGCHSLGIRTNGTAWAWGSNSGGQLGSGNGTTVCRSSPVSVIGGFTDWCQVAAGGFHSLGVRTNGTAWAWGANSDGQLGDGTIVNKSSPVSVIGGFTDWCQVSAGSRHSLGVRTDGTLWAWGCNSNGQLGNGGTGVANASPLSVVGGFTDWCQAAASSFHSLGVRANGTAWAWGSNSVGRLGDGTLTARSSPVSVVGGFTDWCQVSSAGAHSLGVRANGTIWAWGYNASGRLGDGTTTSRLSPVQVCGGFTDWCQASAGNGHSAGIRTG